MFVYVSISFVLLVTMVTKLAWASTACAIKMLQVARNFAIAFSINKGVYIAAISLYL